MADLVAGGGFVFVHVVRGECITHTHTHTPSSHGAWLLPVFAPSLTLSLFQIPGIVCMRWRCMLLETGRQIGWVCSHCDHSLNNKSVPHLLSPLSFSFVYFLALSPAHSLSLSHLINLEPALARDQCMHVSVAILITTLIKFMCTHTYTQHLVNQNSQHHLITSREQTFLSSSFCLFRN